MPVRKDQLVLIVRAQPAALPGHRRITAEVAHRDPKDPSQLLGIIHSSGPYAEYADLKISALFEAVDPAGYGYEIAYCDAAVMDLRRAETAVRTLRKINRKMEKAAEQHGRPRDFATFLIHAAACLGTRTFAEPSEAVRYDGTYYRWLGPDQVKDWINQHTNIAG